MTQIELGRPRRRVALPTTGSMAERTVTRTGRADFKEGASVNDRGTPAGRLQRVRPEPPRSSAPLVADAVQCDVADYSAANMTAAMGRSTRIGHASQVVVQFPVPNSDFGLVAALRANHPDAVGKLCSRHSAEMLQIALGILGPDPRVETLVRITLERAIERLDELPDARDLRLWLLSRLVANLRQRLHARRKLRWLSRTLPSKWSASVGYSERLIATYRALDRMRPQQRILFCLVVIHTMQLSEVAAILGMHWSDAENAMDCVHVSFLRHSRGELRGIAQRRFYFLSLGSEIVSEQERVLRGRKISEYDLRIGFGNFAQRSNSTAMATVTLLFVLLSAVARVVCLP